MGIKDILLDFLFNELIMNENNDLCKTCKYYWIDFPMPLEKVISHCEILDEKYGLEVNMDDIVPYPCLKCPFDCYSKSNLSTTTE